MVIFTIIMIIIILTIIMIIIILTIILIIIVNHLNIYGLTVQIAGKSLFSAEHPFENI